jgi:predicted AlkP superfamily pyrophosphatase or phosphodiesterase
MGAGLKVVRDNTMMSTSHTDRPIVESAIAAAQPSGRARFILVFVLDGLRPDTINPTDTPHLFRLRQEGVNYINGHAVFPTVTRVNAAALATGAYPGTNGIVSNFMYVAEVNRASAFSTGELHSLLTLDDVSGGRLVLVKTLGELLQDHGMQLAVVSSGSTGSSFLLNPRAVRGVGVLVNGYFDPGVLTAFPADVNAAILARFGAAPPKGGIFEPNIAAVNWAEDVLREFVIPELRPDVAVNWLTEPDHMQHACGAGSPESLEMLRNDDRQVGLILEKLHTLGLADQTDIFVVSDHGFSLNAFAVNVQQELLSAGLKVAPDSDDVVVASCDQALLLHIKDRHPERIKQVVEFLQSQEWIGVIFTAGRGVGANRAGAAQRPLAGDPSRVHPTGWVEGTFSLELIHMDNEERGPDILFTFPWTSNTNAFGLAGTDFTNSSRVSGPLTGNRSNHGSMSPWTIRNTFFAWGVDFKRGVSVRVPASNVDIVPTILTLKGIHDHAGLDGRVLLEALQGGADEEQVPVETYVIETAATHGRYRTAIQISQVGNQRYIDKSWRMR